MNTGVFFMGFVNIKEIYNYNNLNLSVTLFLVCITSSILYDPTTYR